MQTKLIFIGLMSIAFPGCQESASAATRTWDGGGTTNAVTWSSTPTRVY